MFLRLKSILGLSSEFEKLVKDLRITEGEKWQQKMEAFRASNTKPVSDKKVTQLGLQLYEAIFQKVIDDLRITKEEKQELAELISFFGLEPSDILQIQQKYAHDAVKRLALEKLDDAILTLEEKEEIKLFASELNLTDTEVAHIQKTAAQNLYQNAVEQAIADGQLTNEERNNLEQLSQKLGLDLDDLGLKKNTQEAYDYLALLNALDNGYLPRVDQSSIVLQRSEIAHWQIQADLLISKVVTTGYTGSSSGVSIRVMKGVSYRVGSSRSRPIKESVSIRYPGILVVTNKRIVFASTHKSFTLPFTQLISFIPYADGLALQKSNGNYLLSLPTNQGAEITIKILANALNKI